MKKIGIITYHHYYNYGTMLQAFALQQAIASLGYDAEVIDFKQNNTLSIIDMLRLRIKRIPVYIKERRKYMTLKSAEAEFQKRSERFEEFYNRYLVVGKRKYTSTQELLDNPPLYDAYVVGSDQTWNPYVANAPEAFYLPFVTNSSKKGSYGPSLAVAELTSDQRVLYKSRLEDFAFLSCREQDGAELLQEVIGRQVETVLDPTLLLDAEKWSSFSNKITIDGPYILEYFLGEKKFHREFAKHLSEITGWKIVAMPVSYLEIENQSIEKIWGGPSEFLALIKNAAVVCTDSFHGTMFSINFNTSFYSFCKTDDSEKESENSRLYSALEMFGLKDRLVKSHDQLNMDTLNINFEKTNAILEKEREHSMAYLQNMLESISK